MRAVNAGVGHAQRLKKILAQKIPVTLPRHLFHNVTEHHVARIDVTPFRSRIEIIRFLLHRLNDGLGGVVGHAAPESRVVVVTVDAGGVGQQLAKGDLVSARKIRDVFGQFIFDAQFFLLLQFQNRRRRKLLRNRTDAEDGLRGDGHTMFQVGQTVALFKKNFAVLCHKDCQARVVGLNQSSQQRVGLFRRCFRRPNRGRAKK